MRLRFLLVCFLFLTLGFKGQNCDFKFSQDTMSLPETNKILEGEYFETTLKDFSVVRLFKTEDDKYYLKFIVKKNFYFDKVDVLEIRSGNKSYYAKNTRQYKIDKTTGLFVIEIFKNYIATLKEDGITSLYFAKAETDFTRQDAGQIKKMAKCFYESLSVKNKF
jgi:hypothetical protein